LEGRQVNRICLRVGLHGKGLRQVGNALCDFGAVFAVDHAKQVVRPVRQLPGAAVAQVDLARGRQALAERTDQRIGHIPHHHGIGCVAQLMVAHHHAKALDDAAVRPAR